MDIYTETHFSCQTFKDSFKYEILFLFLKKRDTNNTLNINLYLRKYDIGRITIYSSNFTSSFIVKKKKRKKAVLGYLYTCVHGSIIHNSQKVEVTRGSID